MRAHASIVMMPSGDERHVDDDAVALLHAEALQGVREAVHLAVEPAVGVGVLLAVLADPDERRLVAPVAVDVAVDAVRPWRSACRRGTTAWFGGWNRQTSFQGSIQSIAGRLLGPEVVRVESRACSRSTTSLRMHASRASQIGGVDDVLVLRELLDRRLLGMREVEAGFRRRFRRHVRLLVRGGAPDLMCRCSRDRVALRFNEAVASFRGLAAVRPGGDSASERRAARRASARRASGGAAPTRPRAREGRPAWSRCRRRARGGHEETVDPARDHRPGDVRERRVLRNREERRAS